MTLASTGLQATKMGSARRFLGDYITCGKFGADGLVTVYTFAIRRRTPRRVFLSAVMMVGFPVRSRRGRGRHSGNGGAPWE